MIEAPLMLVVTRNLQGYNRQRPKRRHARWQRAFATR